MLIKKPNTLNHELFLKRVNDLLEYGQRGMYIRDLEEYVRDYLKVNYVFAIVNPMRAMETLLAVSSVKSKGKQIILPAMFPHTALKMIEMGYIVDFVDINDDFTINCQQLQNKISPDTHAVFAANMFGNVCDLEELESLASYFDTYLFYNSEHAFGCSDIEYCPPGEEFKMIGGYGDAEIFSLGTNSPLYSFGGALITTNKKELANHIKNYIRREEYTLSDIHASLGLSNLEYFGEILSHNYCIHNIYENLLPEGYELIKPNIEFTNHSYVLAKTTKSQPYEYRQDIPVPMLGLEKAAELYKTTISLPIGLNIDYAEVEQICNGLRQ